MSSMNRLSGMVMVAISATAFGTLAIFGRFAYAAGIDIFTLLFLRFTLSTLFIIILLIARKESVPKKGTLIRLMGMGAIGYVAQSLCFLSAIKYASVGLVSLLLYLYPTFVAILSILFLKAKLTNIKIVALAAATVGAMLTANPEGGQWLGVMLALCSAMIYSVYIIVGSGVMRKVSAVQSSTVIFASAAVVFAGLTIINKPHWPETSSGWLAVIGMTLIATVVPVVTFLAGLKRIGPTNAAMLSTLEPVVTVILGALLYREMLRPLNYLGGALILIAVLLLTRSELQQSKIEKIGA